jgi:hypothetical protein
MPCFAHLPNLFFTFHCCSGVRPGKNISKLLEDFLFVLRRIGNLMAFVAFASIKDSGVCRANRAVMEYCLRFQSNIKDPTLPCVEYPIQLYITA